MSKISNKTEGEVCIKKHTPELHKVLKTWENRQKTEA